MPWPTGHDYQIAVQSSSISFKDPALKAGQPELNKLGMPKPRSGSYAVAFKIQSGSRDYAVRCFLGDSLDRQDRYQQISDFLKKAALSYTIDFGYQREGILVNGKWYPMLKMEWVQGDSLGAYVAKNVANPQNLIALAERWVEMSNALNTIGMAHGDLQHGNVLILPNGQIKLIDYDGMYVPALAGRPSEELGQRNYQHPLRTAMDFGPNLDHFSEWVIYVSLVLVSLDPTFWTKLNGGDECLLFRKTDFDDPERSLAFKAMESAPDGRIRSLAETFRTLLYFGASHVPLLAASTMPADPPLIAPSASPGAAGSSWLRDHIPVKPSAVGTPTQRSATAAPISAGSSAAWILDYLGPPAAPQRFTNPLRIERTVLLASVLLLALCFYFFRLDALIALGLFAIGNSALIALRYSRQDIVYLARASARQVSEIKRGIASVNEQLKKLDQVNAADAGMLQQQLARITADRNKIQVSENRDGERPKAQLKLISSSISEARKKLAESDAKELKQLQQGLGAELLEVQKKLAGLDQTQLRDLADTLVTLQRQHVSNAMNSALLARATIPGIGASRRATLNASGIRSAADMQSRGLTGIAGIGPTLQSQLVYWARAIESDAMRTRPAVLTAETERAIKDKYSAARLSLEAKRNDLQRRVAAEQARITATHQGERDSLTQQERQAQTKAAEELAVIHADYLSKYTANDGEKTKARADYASRVISLGEQDQILHQQLAGLMWQKVRLEREHATFCTISFKHYARRVVWAFGR
jgi:hypothetical protein